MWLHGPWAMKRISHNIRTHQYVTQQRKSKTHLCWSWKLQQNHPLLLPRRLQSWQNVQRRVEPKTYRMLAVSTAKIWLLSYSLEKEVISDWQSIATDYWLPCWPAGLPDVWSMCRKTTSAKLTKTIDKWRYRLFQLDKLETMCNAILKQILVRKSNSILTSSKLVLSLGYIGLKM